MLDPTDYPHIHAMALVMADAFAKCGLNVDVAASDWGTQVQRRTSRKPPSEGGWNVFLTFLNGTNNLDPPASSACAANGDKGWFGWARAPRLEELRQAWLDAPGLAAQQAVCAEMQRQFFVDVPYLPLGAYYEATAYRGLAGMRTGFPQFYDVAPA